jgi:hypothetical protein
MHHQTQKDFVCNCHNILYVQQFTQMIMPSGRYRRIAVLNLLVHHTPMMNNEHACPSRSEFKANGSIHIVEIASTRLNHLFPSFLGLNLISNVRYVASIGISLHIWSGRFCLQRENPTSSSTILPLSKLNGPNSGPKL